MKNLLWGVATNIPVEPGEPHFRPAGENGPGATAPFGSMGERPGGEFGPIDIATGRPVSAGPGPDPQGADAGIGGNSDPGQRGGGVDI